MGRDDDDSWRRCCAPKRGHPRRTTWPCRSTFATIGQRPCGRPVSGMRNAPDGRSRACCPIYRPRPRLGCSNTSAPSTHPAVSSSSTPTIPSFTATQLCKRPSSRWIGAVRSERSSENETRIYSEDLFFTGGRADVADWLTEHGWTTTSVGSIEAMARFGRPAAQSVDATTLCSDFVKAHLPA
jgi:hypothetical protein